LSCTLLAGCATGGEVLGCDVDTEFQCSNSKCIPRSRFNNSYNDCGDNSDEGETNSFFFIRTLCFSFTHNVLRHDASGECSSCYDRLTIVFFCLLIIQAYLHAHFDGIILKNRTFLILTGARLDEWMSDVMVARIPLCSNELRVAYLLQFRTI